MTSELRPAMEVWRAARDAWLSGNLGVGPNGFRLGNREAAAAVIEADREAVRAEQAAEIDLLRLQLATAKNQRDAANSRAAKQAAELAKWRDKYNELGQMALEQVSDLGTKLGRLDVELDAAKADLQAANRELAKFKALAETLAGALDQMHRAVCHETGFAEAVRADSGLAYPWEPLDVAADASLKALRQYEEARDVAD